MKFSEMFGSAKWLAPSEKCAVPYMRGTFFAKEGEKTEIVICGLGWFMLYINGKRYGDRLFVPPVSEYHDAPARYCTVKFGERLGTRTYCEKYDITDLCVPGENCIGVMLAGGWYDNPGVNMIPGEKTGYGTVRVCFRITSGDTVSVSEKMKWHPSFVESCSFFRGEIQDLRKAADGWSDIGFDDSGWYDAAAAETPKTEYLYNDCPPDRVIRTVKPRLIRHENGKKTYDAGENISGWPVISSRPGETVEVLCAEDVLEDKSADPAYVHGQRSVFTFSEGHESTHLMFMWNGFRYIEISENGECESVEIVHSDVKLTADFRCENEILNKLFENTVRTQLCNMHAGIPSDCPHLEKRGYTGDGQLMCETVMTLFDARDFYRKWIRDISDCQDRVSGHVNYTAPYALVGGGPGGWGCAIVEVPYQFYKIYGDVSPAADVFDQMLRWFDYLEAKSENGFIVSDQPGLWCLGDWCTPDDIKIDPPFVNNYFYIRSMYRVKELADVLEKDVSFLNARIEERKRAIIERYYDENTGDFMENVQGADAFAYDIGLGDGRTLAHIVERYEKLGMYDTGIFGTDVVTKVLIENGHGELAVSLMASEKEVSFASQQKMGATTLWEYWGKKRSLSHPMFGAVTKYLFSYLLGIKAEMPGYASFKVDPAISRTAGKCSGHITAGGKVITSGE